MVRFFSPERWNKICFLQWFTLATHARNNNFKKVDLKPKTQCLINVTDPGNSHSLEVNISKH